MRKYKYLMCVLFLWATQSVGAGKELAISTAINQQLRPAIASSGDNYLVVWWDECNYASTQHDIWGRIILADGTPMDSFPICTLSQNQILPEVTWGGDKYLVVWDHEHQDVYGQFVDKNGILIDTNFLIAPNSKRYPYAASNGDGYLIAWTETLPDREIGGCLLTKDGSLVGVPFIINAPDTQFHPRATVAGSNYFVVWPDFRSGNWKLYGQKVNPTGTLVGTDFLVSSKANRRLALASNDSLILMGWEENHGMNGFDIYGMMIDTAMNIVHNNIKICSKGGDQRLPCACWHSKTSQFIIGWHDYRRNKADIYIAKMKLDGRCSEEQITNMRSVEQREPDIACSNQCFLIAWEDYRNHATTKVDIYGYLPCPYGIEENAKCKIKSAKLEVYPNPFIGTTAIKLLSYQAIKEKLKIYDVMGRLVEETEPPIIGKNLGTGVYSVKAKGYEPVKIIKLY